jgi:hypothetical protein
LLKRRTNLNHVDPKDMVMPERRDIPSDAAAVVENPETARAWEDEIRRRLKDIDAGKTQMVPGEDVLKEIDDLSSSDRRTAQLVSAKADCMPL